MTIVERIKTLCAESHITIASLERRLNLGNGTIGRWNTASPTVEHLGRVADYFGVSLDYLTGREQREVINSVYLSCLRRAQSQDVDPGDLELALETILKLRKNDEIRRARRERAGQ